MKTETIHTRVAPQIKKQAENIYKKLGLTTSQAVMLFLTASVNCNGLPFDLRISSNNENDYTFAKAVATIDGVEPSKDAQRIMGLYSRGEIDYETAQFAIERMYK